MKGRAHGGDAIEHERLCCTGDERVCAQWDREKLRACGVAVERRCDAFVATAMSTVKLEMSHTYTAAPHANEVMTAAWDALDVGEAAGMGRCSAATGGWAVSAASSHFPTPHTSLITSLPPLTATTASHSNNRCQHHSCHVSTRGG